MVRVYAAERLRLEWERKRDEPAAGRRQRGNGVGAQDGR